MKPTKIYQEFEQLAESLEVKIIQEKGNFKGGYCLLEKEKIIVIKKKLSDGLPTIPTTIKEERECNIFLRSEDKFIQQNLKSNNSLETFSKLRDLKDNF